MNVFIKNDGSQQYQWFVNTEEALHSERFQGSLDELAEFIARKESQLRVNAVLIVSAVDCIARKINFSDKERKHIQKAIPYLLEESVLSDIEDLHIVTGKAEKDHVNVMAIDEQYLAEQLQVFTDSGIELDYCVPEYAAFSQTANEQTWELLYKDQCFLMRSGNGPLSAIEAEHMGLACEVLSENFSTLPNSIELYVEADDEQQALSEVPETLHHLVSIESIDYAGLWQRQFSQALSWNLLTGKFARSLQIKAMLMPWRWVFIALAVVLVAQLGFWSLETKRMNNEVQALRLQMDLLTRQVIPNGKIVDHRKQLQRLLDGQSDDGNSQGFIVKLETVGKVLAASNVQSLNSMNYERKDGQLRLDFTVDNYDVLQTIISAINATGLNAEIQNSNAQGEQLRARLKITG